MFYGSVDGLAIAGLPHHCNGVALDVDVAPAMTPIRNFQDWPAGPLHVAIGVFDGVHLGHQMLMRRLLGGARAAGATAVAATFDPLPGQALAQDPPRSTLADAPERVALLEQAGAGAVVIFTFDQGFSQQSAEEFIKRVTAAGDVRRIVVGVDFQIAVVHPSAEMT